MNQPQKHILKQAKLEFGKIVKRNHLLDTQVSVSASILTPTEAIGTPLRQDFPIIEGKERVIEASFLGAKGQAFTDSPENYQGSLNEILNLKLNSNQNRAILIATINAVLKHLGLVEQTLHCKNEDPEKCGPEISKQILEKWGRIKVGLIGLNPAIAEALVKTFGKNHVLISDLNKLNIDKLKFGIKILDGNTMNSFLVENSELTIITGTTLVNGTFDGIWKSIDNYQKKYMIFGVSAVGICYLQNLAQICPYGRG